MTDVSVVEDRNKYPVHENETSEEVQLCPPRSYQWIWTPRDINPVKSQELHPQPSIHSKELVDYDIIRSDPAYQGEHRQRGEKVSYKW